MMLMWGGRVIKSLKVCALILQLEWEDLGQSFLCAEEIIKTVTLLIFFLFARKGSRRRRHCYMHITQSHGLF